MADLRQEHIVTLKVVIIKAPYSLGDLELILDTFNEINGTSMNVKMLSKELLKGEEVDK